MASEQGSAVQTTERAQESSETVKAILFDMDGVLCNSEEMTQRVGAETLLKVYGVKVDPEEFSAFAGMGEAYFLSGVAGKYGLKIDDINALKEVFYGIYMEKTKNPTESIGLPGSIELVRACREAGLWVAVASSADRIKVDANLALVGFDAEKDFDAIVSADLFERLKPAPDIFLAAAKQLGVEPQNCVVVEDAAAGVQAARLAGMRVIGVTTTLAQEKMQSEAPDAIKPDIGHISVEDLVNLRRAHADTVESGDRALKDRVESGQQASTSQNGAGVGGMDDVLQLPGGITTSRRSALKAVALAGGLGSIYVLLTRAKSNIRVRRALRKYRVGSIIQLGILGYVAVALPYWIKAFSFASPKALLNALLPKPQPAASSGSAQQAERVAAFRRFIEGVERRGGGERVPEFPAGAQWFNSPPLQLARELKGKVLVLDFWTYCCINCMHVLPELAALERKYAGQPVCVVGVHSAKFDNEKDSEAIRNAVLRYGVSHPVINDRNMVLWRDLGVASWPTLMVVSPKGKVIATLAGEGQKQNVDDMLAAALQYYGEAGLLDSTPVSLALEREKPIQALSSPLRYPGKLAADLAGNRLFISDSNNHRLVICDLSGRYIDQIGGNGPALRDGAFDSAAFNRPQGLAFSGRRGRLYVADTENHALREADLEKQTVRTLAGDGTKAEGNYIGGQRGSAQRLNSPWDLAFDQQEDALYIAIAGQHQIWRHDMASGTTAVFSGDGYERNANGRNGPGTSWAQPSGISLSRDGSELWVADSESSTVRSMSLATGGSQAHVGGDPLFAENLFRFGDKDGSGTNALLQHPLAVLALTDGSVIVADSYNHRLKVLDPSSNTIRTLAGSGKPGLADGTGTSAQLSEPGGLCLGPAGTVLVADTNNSLIRKLDVQSGGVETLQLRDVPAPRRDPDAEPVEAARGLGEEAPVPRGAKLIRSETSVASTSAQVQLELVLPPTYHLTKGANSSFQASVHGTDAAGVKLQPATGPLQESGSTLSASISAALPPGGHISSLAIDCKIYFCQEESVCLFEEVLFRVPVKEQLSTEQPQDITLRHTLSPKANSVDFP
ncbi:g6016 [Coccomyxa viridis]|uniref:G6016 protein n=1 Tax=Coccomyxa viridis TaxID=1274662 RepID=A0ABP1FWU8_9CHLO